jgi:DNA-binding NarL/FixJ family response regulator
MTASAGRLDRARVLASTTESAYGARVEILVLGPVAVLRDGADVRLGGPKQRTVLALLAAHADSVVSTDSLLEGLWGESPTPGARSTLQTYVSNLRTELPEVVSQLLARTRRQEPIGDLSPREREVLALMAEGRSNAAIAETLVVTSRAVEKHVKSIFQKLRLTPADTDHRRVLAVLRYLDAR